MKHLRTLFVLAFAAALAGTAAFAEGDKKPEAKPEKAACCTAEKEKSDKGCCAEKKACCGEKKADQKKTDEKKAD